MRIHPCFIVPFHHVYTYMLMGLKLSIINWHYLQGFVVWQRTTRCSRELTFIGVHRYIGSRNGLQTQLQVRYIRIYIHIHTYIQHHCSNLDVTVVHSYKCGKGLTVGMQLVGFQCQTEPCIMQGYRSSVNRWARDNHILTLKRAEYAYIFILLLSQYVYTFAYIYTSFSALGS